MFTQRSNIMNTRNACLSVVSICLFLLSSVSLGDTGEVVLVRNGEMLARIVIPDSPHKTVRQSANLLSDYLGMITGQTAAVHSEKLRYDEQLVEIHIGPTAYCQSLDLGLDALDEDGYVITSPARWRIVIAGGASNNHNGVENGVYEFLKRYCGVRWLFPGEIGTEIPPDPNLKINVETIREEPVYLSRRWGAATDTWGTFERASRPTRPMAVWARRHRERGRIDYHHNAWKIFSPKRIGKSHPHVFAVRNGERFVPTPDHHAKAYWQPCYSAPASAEVATDFALDTLRTREVKTLSLGVNDEGGFCECPRCRELDGNRKNYLGQQDRTRSYFTWANAVATNVCREWPKAKFGFLAYSEIAQPPTDMPIHPALVPYITSDRIKWQTPEYRRRDIEIHRKWQKAATAIGWYDYTYGDFYPVPRVYFHVMADYLRWGSENGAKYYYTEANPTTDWHEGPKFSLALALLWNPYIDVDEFLQDWYESAVGPQAAPILKAYFDFWEDFWTRQVPQTDWYRQGAQKQYFTFMNYDYLRLIGKDDIAMLRGLIEDLPAKTPAGRKRKRAEYMRDAYCKRLDEIRLRSDFVKSNWKLEPTPPDRVVFGDSFATGDGLSSWDLWTRAYGKINSCVLPRFAGATGVLRMDLSEANSSPAALQRSFRLKEGKVYVVSFRTMCEKLDADVRVNVRFHQPTPYRREANRDIPTLKSPTQRLPEDRWQDVRFAFAIPQGTPDIYLSSVVVTLYIGQTNSGAVLVDSFSLGESDIK